jgi:probable F420-dependent oxidoreductase
VDFGISYFPTDESIEPAEMARMCEERGFESVFVTEHTHVPVNRETPHPAFEELPREYTRIHDPFVSAAMMAAATERIMVGTAICLIIERDPITTAKEVASVDSLSGGRFIFGVGAGWLLEEMRNHGTDPERRFGILRERVEAMRTIWTEDEAEYHGRYVDFDPIWCWPKPVQKPHPPVLIGGNGRTVYDRVIGYGDGWMPNRIGDDDKIIARIEKLQGLGRDAGRDSVPVSLQLPPRKDHALLQRYENAGVTRSIFMLPATDRDDVERKLDQFTEAQDSYNAAGG